MYNLLIMLSKEKGRRIKKFCLEKPFVLISGIASLIYLFYCYISWTFNYLISTRR